MQSDYKDILSQDNAAYMIKYDQDSDGLIAHDQNGAILNGPQIEQLITGLTNFKNHYSEDSLAIARNKALNQSAIVAYNFKKAEHKAGEVFIYKETNTNKYRIVATQNSVQRLKTLKYEYPTTLEVIGRKYTQDVNLLKAILLDKFHEHHSHDNWFDLTDKDINYFRNEAYT